MKVAVIGTVGVPANYGGFETLAENLLTYKKDKSIEYRIFCSSKHYNKKLSTYKGAILTYVPLEANGKTAPLYDMYSLCLALKDCDVILSLGASCSPLLSILKPWIRQRVIINIDGIDTDRAKVKGLTRRLLDWIRRLAAKHADVCVADNQGIVEHVNKEYGCGSKLIEYGGDNAFKITNPTYLKYKYGLNEKSYSFKVARIEAENNIEMILEAFSKMPNETLVIVGNWNRSEFGCKMRESYSVYPNILLLDPIYDPNELNLLRSNCKLYIHGHSVGGTNPSLVEAMNLGLPIIAYDVIFNRATTENSCEYFSSANELRCKVTSLQQDITRLHDISSTMHKIAKRRYTWEIIVSKYEKLYRE